MQFSVETRQEMQRAFERCREVIRAYPSPYAETGVRYLDKFDPERGSGPTNYICCLLPYWLRQAADVPLETCRRIAEANVFGMLHFHLLDEQMDRSEAPERARIALSQLFNAEMNARYAERFRSPEAFRSALLRCSVEWAAGIASEREADPFFERPELLAARSAPLLLCPLALFEDDDRMLARARHAVQEVLITLQMADDWADYAEDLQDGSYNCLVSLHRRERNLPSSAPLTSGDIDQAVYAGGILGRYAEYASRRQTGLESFRDDFPGLIAFHAALAGDLERIAAGIEAEKQTLSLGGLNYWLLGRDDPS